MWNREDIRVNYMVRRQTFAGWAIPTRRLVDYELVLVLRGRGYICIAGENREIRAGDMICFRPGVEHSLWVEQAPHMEFYAMHFDIPPEERPLPFPDVFHLDAPHRLEGLFKQLHGTYMEKGYMHLWRQSILLQQILLTIFTTLHEKQETMGNVRVRRALEYIHEDPCREMNLETLLRQAGVQKTIFMRSFREMTGTTPIQYIMGLRLENARDLLENTGLSVTQIAAESGFSDPLYFSRCFHRRFSLSPRQYRKQKSSL